VAWLRAAFDVLTNPEIVELLGELTGEVVTLDADASLDLDRKHRSQLRKLARIVRGRDAAEEARAPEPDGDDDAELADEAREPLFDLVRRTFAGKHALWVGNRSDPDLVRRLREVMELSTTVCDGTRVESHGRAVQNGTYDLVLVSDFINHRHDDVLRDAAKAAAVPYVRVGRGRPLAIARAIVQALRLDRN